ncbi:hypothetical protein ACD591_15665, partial [Rufibacter glacialis]
MFDIKRIFRAVLWRTGLGELIAKSFWKKVETDDDIVFLYKNSKYVFNKISIRFDFPEYNGYLLEDTNKWAKQEEFVLLVKDAFVEPERGIAIKYPNKVILQTTIIDSQFPYILPYLLNRYNAVKIDSAVLYDGYATKNYYHHLLNGVNSIHMLEKVDLPNNIPFLITRSCFEHKYFQYLYRRSGKFRGLNWLVQEPDE